MSAGRTVEDDVREFGNGFSVNGVRVDPRTVTVHRGGYAVSAGKVDVPCRLCGGCLEVMLPCPACQGAASSANKADALVVIDSLLEWLDHDGYDTEAARIRAVRADVADLIEADRAYDKALGNFNNNAATVPSWPFRFSELEAAKSARAAALARIGGAP